nr:NADH dehydrogenase subunit 2 [Megacopta cribraria]UYA97473.1 NADH dehydrogenase subunit 2 [Megacopta cribraria]
MHKTKTVFFVITILGPLITMFSNSWISMWMGLEINMMAFIPLIKKKANSATAEATMMYFLVQSVSSSILMFSIIMSFLWENNEMMMTITFMSLLVKLGAAPFHMWVPEIMSKMDWNSCILLMTWQKIAPLSMIMNIKPQENVLMMTVMLSTAIGAIGGINQTSLRKIMAYSSINHLAWMMITMKTLNNWIMYLVMYSVMTATICVTFKKYNMMFINQINSMNLSLVEKITYMTSMMSLGGLPPFIGFLPKWMIIQAMMKTEMVVIMMIMVMFSLITLFYYMRTMSFMSMSQASLNKWLVVKSKSPLILWNILLNLSLPMSMMINFT